MACGLGAVILLFMIIKQSTVPQDPVPPQPPTSELADLQAQQAALQDSLSGADAATQAERQRIARIKAEIAALEEQLRKSSDVTSAKLKELSALKDAIKNAPKAHKNDVVQNDTGGEENYVMGLKVEGRRIALLVDASASMTDEKLIDIIRRKNTTAAEKKQGPKWLRTKRVVRWLLARLPENSEVSVILFNRQATLLGGLTWVKARDGAAIQRFYTALDAVVPEGSTNLQIGLNKAGGLSPSHTYVVTDGLPTDGPSNYGSLNPFAACSSLLGKSSNITGECRVKLFRQTIKDSRLRMGVPVNVVLLPLEGDPEAAPEYWSWTAATGGLLISPAENWP